jgi:hypothetical protein
VAGAEAAAGEAADSGWQQPLLELLQRDTSETLWEGEVGGEEEEEEEGGGGGGVAVVAVEAAVEAVQREGW